MFLQALDQRFFDGTLDCGNAGELRKSRFPDDGKRGICGDVLAPVKVFDRVKKRIKIRTLESLNLD